MTLCTSYVRKCACLSFSLGARIRRCGACQHFKPAYEAASDLIAGSRESKHVTVARVDCATENFACQQVSVRSYPTVLLGHPRDFLPDANATQRAKYGGSRDNGQPLVDWVAQQIGRYHSPLHTILKWVLLSAQSISRSMIASNAVGKRSCQLLAIMMRRSEASSELESSNHYSTVEMPMPVRVDSLAKWDGYRALVFATWTAF